MLALIIYLRLRKYIRETLLDLVAITSIDPIQLHIDLMKIIKQNIIIAPHTLYHVKQDLRDAVAVPLSSIPRVSNKTSVRFVKPLAEIHNDNESIRSKCNFARQIKLYVSFQLSQVWLTISRNNSMLVFEKDSKLPN